MSEWFDVLDNPSPWASTSRSGTRSGFTPTSGISMGTWPCWSQTAKATSKPLGGHPYPLQSREIAGRQIVWIDLLV